MRKMLKKLFGLGLLMMVLVSCGSTPKVKIAVDVGAVGETRQKIITAIELAAKEAQNKAGDKEVELVIFDTSEADGSLSVTKERDLAEKIIADNSYLFYLGPNGSGQAKVSMPLLNQAEMAQIPLGASWPGLTKQGFDMGEPEIYYPTRRRHFFRVNLTDEVQGKMAAKWAQQMGKQKIYIVDDSTTYGIGLAGIFERSAEDLGLEIIQHESYSNTATAAEMESLAERIVAAQPDLLYYGSTVGQREEAFVADLRKLNPTLSIMGGDSFLSYFVGGEDKAMMEGIYATTISIPAEELESAQGFITSYHQNYGKDPEGWTVIFYEATKVALRAIANAKEPTRKGVLDAMENFGEYSGALGTWHFDKNGDISLTGLSGWQIKNGQWEFVQIIE